MQVGVLIRSNAHTNLVKGFGNVSQSQKHKIMIVGAGIAGLTAALCLRQSGHDVIILEQASALQNIGAGIQLSPNALHAGTR